MPITVRVGKYDDPITFKEFRRILDVKDKQSVIVNYDKYNEPQKFEKIKKGKNASSKKRYQRMKAMYSTCKKVVTCPFCGSKIQTKAWYCTACKSCKAKFHISPSERIKKGEEMTAPNRVDEDDV